MDLDSGKGTPLFSCRNSNTTNKMITTTKKIAERASHPDFKDEPCVVFPADRMNPQDLIRIAHDLQTALYLHAFYGEIRTDVLSSLQECIDAMSIEDQLKPADGKMPADGKIIIEL